MTEDETGLDTFIKRMDFAEIVKKNVNDHNLKNVAHYDVLLLYPTENLAGDLEAYIIEKMGRMDEITYKRKCIVVKSQSMAVEIYDPTIKPELWALAEEIRSALQESFPEYGGISLKTVTTTTHRTQTY